MVGKTSCTILAVSITKNLHKMNTSTNEKLITLINRAFDENGILIDINSRKNKREAKELLESGVSFYGETVSGYDAHISLLVIAYPNKKI